MEDQLPISGAETEATPAKEEKKKKKEQKEDLTLEKLELSLYRAQLAVVRTATTTTTLGFALYKFIEEKSRQGKDGPIMHIFTPRIIAIVLFFAGFLALISYSIRHVATLKKINRFTVKFYYSGVMVVSYIILLLTLLLLIGALLNSHI